MRPTKLDDVIGLTLPLNLPLSARERLSAVDEQATAAIQDDVLGLFDECAGGLRRYVRTFGLSAEATEDVLQDVFLSLFRHLRLGRPRHNLKGWLYQVAHNLALKQRHRTHKRQRTESDWDAHAASRAVDPTANPEQRLAEAYRWRRFRAVLRAIPERDRRCLYLRAEGLGYRDIARTMGMSLGGVAKVLARAIGRLTSADRG